jgi:hypothetical protein
VFYATILPATKAFVSNFVQNTRAKQAISNLKKPHKRPCQCLAINILTNLFQYFFGPKKKGKDQKISSQEKLLKQQEAENFRLEQYRHNPTL